MDINYSRSKYNTQRLSNEHIIYLFKERKDRICKESKYLSFYILHYDEYRMFVNNDNFEIDDVVKLANKELMFLRQDDEENY